MSALRKAMQALDLGNAAAWAKMGMRDKQVFDVFGAYFRGAMMPKAGTIGLDGLSGLASRPGVGAARAGLFAFGALATWNMMPRSNALAIPSALGAAVGTYAMLGNTSMAANKGLRAGAGLLSGSLMYQGLRSTHPTEHQVKM